MWKNSPSHDRCSVQHSITKRWPEKAQVSFSSWRLTKKKKVVLKKKSLKSTLEPRGFIHLRSLPPHCVREKKERDLSNWGVSVETKAAVRSRRVLWSDWWCLRRREPRCSSSSSSSGPSRIDTHPYTSGYTQAHLRTWSPTLLLCFSCSIIFEPERVCTNVVLCRTLLARLLAITAAA